MLRALLERHDHIVQEVDGQNDFGEDLYVTFTASGYVTGDMIKIQVKGGSSWRRANGYGVPVGHHTDTWRDGNVPVICVVHDPETNSLYWANATQQLLAARRESTALANISVSSDDLLDDTSVTAFVDRARRYVSRYRGNQAVRTQLGEMAGVEFGGSDTVLHFVNKYGEDLIFWQRDGEGYATLLHSDLDWDPRYIGPEMLRFDTPLGFVNVPSVPTVGNVILNMAEAMWLAACFAATEWSREAAPDREPLETRIEVQDSYVADRIQNRLRYEPDALIRSIEILRDGSKADPAVLAEIGTLETDPSLRAEALSTPWDKLSRRAQRLTSLYLVKEVLIGEPLLPIDQQFRIVWRSKRPCGEYGFSARVGAPSTRLTPQREIARASQLKPGDRIYWLSQAGNERGRTVSAPVWASDETPGAVCVLLDHLSLGDTFWPGERFARKKRSP